MKTKRRFSLSMLARFVREGRGTGVGTAYKPWHQVRKRDPSSHGRSHLQELYDRQCHLLSDAEKVTLLFCSMLPNLQSVCEQFPLKLTFAPHELGAYDIRYTAGSFPGTLQIAQALGIKHPVIREEGEKQEWISTTDLLLIFLTKAGQKLVAVSVKAERWSALSKRRRTLQLLDIERSYWLARNVPWLLITPDLFDPEVGQFLQIIAPWTLGAPASHHAIATAMKMARRMPAKSITTVISEIAQQIGDADLAQRALWQAVWTGRLPCDLRRGWRPHVPLRLMRAEEFHQFNPVAMMRSAWI